MVALSRRINRCNAGWALAGLPALTLPCFGGGALPAGVQLVGAPGADERLLDLGAAIQAGTDWHLRWHDR
jgi:Asp-tRNA(Asn)/Glu-tRNA(Gln) amidotransferase A subunit family amidase